MLVGVVGMNGQYGDRGAVHDPLGRAPEKQVAKARHAAGAHDDHVGAVLGGELEYERRRRADVEIARRLDAPRPGHLDVGGKLSERGLAVLLVEIRRERHEIG